MREYVNKCCMRCYILSIVEIQKRVDLWWVELVNFLEEVRFDLIFERSVKFELEKR